MSSSRIEHVLYNAHAKVSHYVLRHTSRRLRSIIEQAVLVLAVCAFCVVILSHRTFVHREDIAFISCEGDAFDTCSGETATSNFRIFSSSGIFGERGGVSMYSFVVQLVWSGYDWMVSKRTLSNTNHSNSNSWTSRKTIPGTCLKGIAGFREDIDVNHIILRYERDDQPKLGSQAFTIHRGGHGHETTVSGMPINSTQQLNVCVIRASPQSKKQRSPLFGFARDQLQDRGECSPQITSFLAHHGYLSNELNGTIDWQQQQYSKIIYSYSHSQGLLRLKPSLQHIHNVSTQFIIASTTDPQCFGEPFAQSIVFRLVGPDTVILNWILGLQHAIARPRFVYHWKTKKELDLDVFDMDYYAFSSKSTGDGYSNSMYETMLTTSASPLPFASMNKVITRVQKDPMYRFFLRFLAFKFLVLLSTLLIFSLTTSLVNFTFQETQDRMLEFTLQLQTRVRARRAYRGLIVNHVLENLMFVPILCGMIFFLIEFYGDKFLAFMVLSLVWVCEVFSAISIRSTQGMHYFPRVFFLYFTLFHVYFFSCPIGFTYASLASTILFLCHTMLFFWNRYELPALHAGLVTLERPRMRRLGVDREREMDEVNGIMSPHVVQSLLITPQLHQEVAPRAPSSNERSSHTASTVPLSSMRDFTPQSDQHYLLRSFVAAASTSLQSIQSFASIQSTSSLAAERTTSPNFIFHGGYSFNDVEEVGDGEEDSFIARVQQ